MSDHQHQHQHRGSRPDFEPAQHAMTLYYRALSGRACEIVPYDDDADEWQHPDTATTIRLPSHAPHDDHGQAQSQQAQCVAADVTDHRCRKDTEGDA